MMTMLSRTVVLVSILIILLLAGFSIYNLNSIFLPGRQPNVVESHETPTYCQSCHQTGTSGNPVTITADWQGSLMAHAARDPIFTRQSL